MLLSLLTGFLGYSQGFDIEWGPMAKSKNAVLSIYKVDGNSFYADCGGTRGYAMMVYKNYNLASKTIYETVVDRKSVRLEGRFYFGDKILIFTSKNNDEDTQKSLYVHEFRESSEPIEIEGKKLVSFNFDKKDKRRTDFGLLISENREKMCVTYIATQRKDRLATTYGYYILDSDLKVESEGSFGDLLEPEVESVDEYKLSNGGDLFLVTKVKRKDQPEFMKFYKVNGEESKELEMKLKGNYVNQLSIALDEKDNFVVSGFYGRAEVKGETRKTGVRGVFYVIMDPDTEEILSSGFNEFDDAFIMEGLSERQKARSEKAKEKRGLEPSLQNFQMRLFEPTQDGGSFGLAEEYYMRVTTSHDPKTGRTTVTYHYYYNDLIAFKLNKEGELEWKKKIQKYQYTTDDNGFFSSFTCQRTKEKFYILFNDNAQNYDEISSKFLDKEIPMGMRLSAKKNVIALVEIDLETGDIGRSAMGGREEIGAILTPKLCAPSETEPSILLYTAKSSKQRLGRISFN